jgi:pimeloyl-ACP methyl ester carboxylesterase
MSKVFVPTARPTSPRRARHADAEYGTSAEPNWRSIDWPAHVRTVEVDGVGVNYVDIGEGRQGLEPILFIHGLGGQWQNWLENIPHAAQERRVVALDLPGFGLSPLPRDEITISAYGRSVEAFCETLGLGRVDVVGNSMGGFIAAELAIQFPDRVDQLLLVSAAGITSADISNAPIITAGRVISAVATHGAARHRKVAARPGTRHAALALVARHPSRLKPDLAYEGFFKGAGKPGFDPALRASLDYDFRDRLPEIRHPTLIVWGQNDSIIPVKDAQEFERLIPDSRKVVMKETGHVPMAERPGTFNDLMMDFLAETGRASEKEPAPGESQVA